MPLVTCLLQSTNRMGGSALPSLNTCISGGVKGRLKRKEKEG